MLAYNMKRVMKIVGIEKLIAKLREIMFFLNLLGHMRNKIVCFV